MNPCRASLTVLLTLTLGLCAAARASEPKLQSASKEEQAEFERWEKLGATFRKDSAGHVTRVNIEEARISDADLATLAKFPHLRIALLSTLVNRGEITDAGLKHLRLLTQLEMLDLGYWPKITDDGLQHLSGLANLRMLRFHNQPGITDAGLTYLKPLGKLEHLCLSGTGVTDAGLLQLFVLKNLKRVDLLQTAVTAEGAASLRAALPDCHILHRVSKAK